MTELFKTCVGVINNPSFIRGFICGMSFFLVPKVVSYWSRKTGLLDGDDHGENEEEEEEDDSDSGEYEDIDSASDLDDNPLGDETKLLLVVRNDLGMGKGKAAAQCAHAAVQAYRQASVQSKQILQSWIRCGQRKVVVKVKDEAELLKLEAESRRRGLVTALIIDAGRTQIASGSKTVLGIGPAPKSKLDEFTSDLKLY